MTDQPAQQPPAQAPPAEAGANPAQAGANKAMGALDSKVKTFHLCGEAEDKCCWFIPIPIGVMIVGIFLILYAISIVLSAIGFLGLGSTFLIWAILYFVTCVPIIIGAYFFIRYFMDRENAERKAGTTKACLCVIITAFL